jgi:hypothetical protein
MTIRKPFITTDTEGKRYHADQVLCDCGAQAFQIIHIHDQDHFHFKCLYCEEIFCGTIDGSVCNKKGAVPINADNQ